MKMSIRSIDRVGGRLISKSLQEKFEKFNITGRVVEVHWVSHALPKRANRLFSYPLIPYLLNACIQFELEIYVMFGKVRFYNLPAYRSGTPILRICPVW